MSICQQRFLLNVFLRFFVLFKKNSASFTILGINVIYLHPWFFLSRLVFPCSQLSIGKLVLHRYLSFYYRAKGQPEGSSYSLAGAFGGEDDDEGNDNDDENIYCEIESPVSVHGSRKTEACDENKSKILQATYTDQVLFFMFCRLVSLFLAKYFESTAQLWGVVACSLVDSLPFVRRVAGSNPALAVT